MKNCKTNDLKGQIKTLTEKNAELEKVVKNFQELKGGEIFWMEEAHKKEDQIKQLEAENKSLKESLQVSGSDLEFIQKLAERLCPNHNAILLERFAGSGCAKCFNWRKDLTEYLTRIRKDDRGKAKQLVRECKEALEAWQKTHKNDPDNAFLEQKREAYLKSQNVVTKVDKFLGE